MQLVTEIHSKTKNKPQKRQKYGYEIVQVWLVEVKQRQEGQQRSKDRRDAGKLEALMLTDIDDHVTRRQVGHEERQKPQPPPYLRQPPTPPQKYSFYPNLADLYFPETTADIKLT